MPTVDGALQNAVVSLNSALQEEAIAPTPLLREEYAYEMENVRLAAVLITFAQVIKTATSQ